MLLKPRLLAFVLLRSVIAMMAIGFISCDSSEMDANTGAAWDDNPDQDSSGGDTGTSDGQDDADNEENEVRFDYRMPQVSGRFVFIADQANNTVVVVDTLTLAISLVDVSAGPTHLIPLNDMGAAAVIGINANAVSLVSVDDSGVPEVSSVSVRPDTNALAASPGGRFIVAFWDALFEDETGQPGTDQEISIIDTTLGQEGVFHMTVGMHPKKVMFNAEGTHAYIITEGGIDVVDLENLATVQITTQIDMVDDAQSDPDDVTIEIDPLGNVAFARTKGLESLLVVDLNNVDDRREYGLAAAATDLKTAGDGSFGVVVMREENLVGIFDLPLPPDGEPLFSETIGLGESVCGLVSIAPDGEDLYLYTTSGGSQDDKELLTTLTKTPDGWIQAAKQLERKIQAVRVAPDSMSVFVNHSKTEGEEFPYAYSLVNAETLQAKLQRVVTNPGQLLFLPDGTFAYLLLRDDDLGVKKVDIINTRSFIVDELALGSPPKDAGFAPLTKKVFVAQEHPSGRLTFISTETGAVQTVTGFTLNDEISD